MQFIDLRSPARRQVASATAFLNNSHREALARFRTRANPRPTCRTVEYSVPPKPGDEGSTGVIVAHLSPAVSLAWEASASGTLRQKRDHVQRQVRLALEDLAEQDMHGYLALSPQQRAVYNPDFVQMMEEALDRTTFSHLGRRPDPRWQGTLVESVEPPYLVLVVSVAFAKSKRTALHRPKAPTG